MEFLSRSAPFADTRRQVERFAPLPHAVLLTGETGSGKDYEARRIHLCSNRASGPFVDINCAAITGTLADSDLFGHVRGAFTGADRPRTGAFQRAHRGTLFLDELGELPPGLQAKLLRVLETNRVMPVGGEQEFAVDVRVVSATHRDLDEMVRLGTFREDLLHRIRVLEVRVPPLRERRVEIPDWLNHFLSEARAELGKSLRLDNDALQAALSHPWPGNIRGLANAVRRAAALADHTIAANDLVPPEKRVAYPQGEITLPRGDYHSMQRRLLEMIVEESGSIRKAAKLLKVPRSTLGGWLKRP